MIVFQNATGILRYFGHLSTLHSVTHLTLDYADFRSVKLQMLQYSPSLGNFRCDCEDRHQCLGPVT